MNRSDSLEAIRDTSEPWDFIIIGGGATGLGTAVDAASRGYHTLLVEQCDFAKGTSSRSTKLVHGGVRYLRQGNVSLVIEALHERGLLRHNAPHLVSNLAFVVPNYDWWEGPFYGIGLKVYDMLAGKLGLGPSKWLSREETLERLPTIEPEGLRGGVVYYDAQFDDARLATNLAQTCMDQGGFVINYMKVTGLLKHRGFVQGVVIEDQETGETHEILGRVVINATGAFTDAIRRMDDPRQAKIIQPSQGVHIVLDQSFLPGGNAIMVPETDDGRVLFAIPWHNRVIVGTTDTPVDEATLEPRAQAEEIEFLITHAARYLTKDPTPADVLSVFAGIRPLVRAGDGNTAELSRDHTLYVSESGLVTITGGKWTTYRKMAEDTVNMGIGVGMLEERACHTHDLDIHGRHDHAERFGDLAWYGSDALEVQAVLDEVPAYTESLHPNLPYKKGEVIWATRHEMARSVEDVLARRTRSLLLDARASIEIAPLVAELMAGELGRDQAWVTRQVETYRALASGYVLKT